MLAAVQRPSNIDNGGMADPSSFAKDFGPSSNEEINVRYWET